MCSFEGVFLFYFCNLSSFFGGRVEVVARKILGQGYVHNLEHNLCVNKIILSLQPTQGNLQCSCFELFLEGIRIILYLGNCGSPSLVDFDYGMIGCWGRSPSSCSMLWEFFLPPLICFKHHVPLLQCVDWKREWGL